MKMMVPDMMTMKSAGTNDQQPSSSKVNSTMQTTPLQWASEASTTKRHENRRRLQNLITNIYKPQMWCFETWTRTSSKTAIKKAMLEKRGREREKPTARTIITNIININGHQRQDKTYVKETKLPAEAGRCPWRHAITTSLLPFQFLTDSLLRPFKIAPYNPDMCVNLACHERAGNTKSKAHTHFQAFLKSEHKSTSSNWHCGFNTSPANRTVTVTILHFQRRPEQMKNQINKLPKNALSHLLERRKISPTCSWPVY